MMKPHELPIYETAELLKKKELSSLELTKSYLERIRNLDPKIQSFLTITEDEAIKSAKRADELISQRQFISPLLGIPYALKDVITTYGIKTTAGSKILENYYPPFSATVYEKLKSAGAVLLGKTNLDEFAMGASTENSGYKKTYNPYDRSRVPGGSSGGSAAAVAADFAAFALGSDTGGSIRQPSSFCNVVGLKPTYGRVSRYGLIAMASSLDQIGPITKNVFDSALVLKEIAGYDGFDANALNESVPEYYKAEQNLQNLKIGLPKEYIGEGIDKKVKETVLKAIKTFEKLGVKIEEISLPHTKEALPTYYIIMPSEVSANLARFDGIRFGFERDRFGDEVKRRIILGTYALSSGYYDAYYLKAARIRSLIISDFAEAFKKVDLIVGPVAPTVAFKIGEKTQDPLQMYLSDILTIPVNLAGLPAISIPCGFVGSLPVGLQIISKQFGEREIFSAARIYEKATNWSQNKPNL